MKVLVLNCGSSSIKFQLFQMEKEEVIARGLVEKIGSSEAIVNYTPQGKDKIVKTREILNHDRALTLVFDTLLQPQSHAARGHHHVFRHIVGLILNGRKLGHQHGHPRQLPVSLSLSCMGGLDSSGDS